MALVAADHPPLRVQERLGPLPVAVGEVEYEVLHPRSVRVSAFPRNDQTSLPESGPCRRKIYPEQKFVELQGIRSTPRATGNAPAPSATIDCYLPLGPITHTTLRLVGCHCLRQLVASIQNRHSRTIDPHQEVPALGHIQPVRNVAAQFL